MASLRKLKKDVNYVTYELLTECFTLKHFHTEMDDTKFEKVIREIVKKRNELISMINNPEKQESKSKSRYFKEVRGELINLIALAEKAFEK